MNLDPTIVLYRGSHNAGNEMCAMEAVAFVAGEAWSDHPACASEVIGRFLRCWNDDLNADGRQILLPYIRRIVGTRAGPEIERQRQWMCTDWLVRVHAPAWLEAAGLTEQANALRELPEIVGVVTLDGALPTIETGRTKATAARDAASWAANAATRAACDAAWSASRAAARAASGAARVVARDAAWAAAATGAALEPTVRALQVSALALLDRMIALTEVSDGR